MLNEILNNKIKWSLSSVICPLEYNLSFVCSVSFYKPNLPASRNNVMSPWRCYVILRKKRSIKLKKVALIKYYFTTQNVSHAGHLSSVL